ncbi:hypothetical protein V1523DRAFT_460382 [Lipomyces doorenjongii]
MPELVFDATHAPVFFPLITDINAKDMEKELHFAESNLALNATGEGRSMLLHHAVDSGNMLIVQSLLAEDALNPNVANNDGLTPLDCAARNDDGRMVDLLLTREDIQVNAGSHKSRSPVALAAEGRHFILNDEVQALSLFLNTTGMGH